VSAQKGCSIRPSSSSAHREADHPSRGTLSDELRRSSEVCQRTAQRAVLGPRPTALAAARGRAPRAQDGTENHNKSLASDWSAPARFGRDLDPCPPRSGSGTIFTMTDPRRPRTIGGEDRRRAYPLRRRRRCFGGRDPLHGRLDAVGRRSPGEAWGRRCSAEPHDEIPGSRSRATRNRGRLGGTVTLPGAPRFARARRRDPSPPCTPRLRRGSRSSGRGGWASSTRAEQVRSLYRRSRIKDDCPNPRGPGPGVEERFSERGAGDGGAPHPEQRPRLRS